MDYPIILHILSYNDEHLCMLISKGLQVYNSSVLIKIITNFYIYKKIVETGPFVSDEAT